ncbi:MAG: VIT domain-containing protein [Kofleriaceae bacterium]
MRTLLPSCVAVLAACNTPLPSETLRGGEGNASAPTAAMFEAMAYVATDEQGPPFSLTSSDGAGLLLTKIDAKAVVDGPLAFTELHLYFHNPEARVREGRFAVTLPDEAALSRFAMENDGQWMEAEVVPKMVARRAYEDFLHRRQDPALLEKAAGNEFSARVFPIPANGDKHLVLSYSQELRGDQYTLPLRGLAAIDKVDATVRVVDAKGAAQVHTLNQKAWRPDRDFAIALPEAGAVAAGGLVAMRATVELLSTSEPVTDALFLLDSSASRALGYREQVRALHAVIAGLAKARPELQLELAAFDQETVSLYKGKASGFGEAQVKAVASREPLGASDLGQALRWAKAHKRRRVVVVSDAMLTAGADAAALPALVRELGAERLDVVLAGGLRDAALAATLTQAGLPKAGAVLELTAGPAEVARRLSLATQTQIPVAVTGATWSWPTSLPAAQPGDRVVVFAQLAKPGPIELRLGDRKLSQTPRVVTGPLLQRAGARALIAELEAQISAEADATKRSKLREELSALSVKHRVLSSETAMLVLESEADYDRYQIARNSLSDVLVVGPSGVELAHRAGPVLMAADPKPAPQKSDRPKMKRALEARANGPSGGGAATRDEGGMAVGNDDDASDMEEAEKSELSESDVASIVDRLPTAGNHEDPSAAPPPAAPAPEPRASRPSPQVAHQAAVAAENRRMAAAARRPRADQTEMAVDGRATIGADAPAAKPAGPEPLTGELAEIMKSLDAKRADDALRRAWTWRHKDQGDLLALIGLGEALEAKGDRAQAARAYGSIIDLFPARADLRRFAGQRLERLDRQGASVRELLLDTYRRALADRPDHLTGYRLLAYALVRAGDLPEAFATVERGLRQSYPPGRFPGGDRILREDAGLIAAAWIAKDPKRRAELSTRLSALGASLETAPSTRFVLYWETDANDVDFHIRDARGGHAYYQAMTLPSGGALYQDVTTGYGPECFTIPGVPKAGPYQLSINYYSQGPMGFGMGLLEVLVHDGKGGLTFDERPYVVMQPGAFVELGTIGKGAKGGAVIAK